MNIVLDSGRHISLSHLEQWRTYCGLLCGTPTRGDNDERLVTLLDETREKMNLGAAVLIPPARTPIPRREPDSERLPEITCIGVFDSDALRREDSEPYSSLAVVWMQEAFALPIDEGVLRAIRAIKWEIEAKDWCW